MDIKNILESLKEIRKTKERKFKQSADLIINLKDFDARKESINLFLDLPHKIKDIQVGAFLNSKSEIVDSITKTQFNKFKKPAEIKKLVNKYDFFISSASLMPSVASTFGKYLGPTGKMPSPQLGIIREEKEVEIKKIIERFEKVIRIKSKEASLKFCIGKESMTDEEIAENVLSAYKEISNVLPKKKESVKSVMIKFTMGKPTKIKFE